MKRTEKVRETSETKLRYFIKEACDLLYKELRQLYPTEKEIKRRGIRRLNLFYAAEEDHRPITPSCGQTCHEWKELDELLFSFWNEKYPFYLPKEPRTVSGFESHPPIGQILGITRACWVLFINFIPQEDWEYILIILMKHNDQLRKLDFLLGVREDYNEVEKNKRMIAKDRLLVTLRTLHLALRQFYRDSGLTEDHYVILSAVLKVEEAVKQHGELAEEISNLKGKLLKEWQSLGGPPKIYERDASRLFRPVVKDLYEQIRSIAIRYKKQRKELPPILVDEHINDQAIFRIIGDLIRFFFDWGTLRAIQPPEWGRVGEGWIWGLPYLMKDKTQTLEKEGKKKRDQFGERMRQIKQGLDK